MAQQTMIPGVPVWQKVTDRNAMHLLLCESREVKYQYLLVRSITLFKHEDQNYRSILTSMAVLNPKFGIHTSGWGLVL